jgi:hypothetical protein
MRVGQESPWETEAVSVYLQKMREEARAVWGTGGKEIGGHRLAEKKI